MFKFHSGNQEWDPINNLYSCYKGSPAIVIWSAELWNEEQKISFYDLFPYIEKELTYEEQTREQKLEDVIDWTTADLYSYFYNNDEFCIDIDSWYR